MIHNANRLNLVEALEFQKAYSQGIIDALEKRFQDNDIVDAFKKFNPSNMPSRQVGLTNRGYRFGIVDWTLWRGEGAQW